MVNFTLLRDLLREDQVSCLSSYLTHTHTHHINLYWRVGVNKATQSLNHLSAYICNQWTTQIFELKLGKGALINVKPMSPINLHYFLTLSISLYLIVGIKLSLILNAGLWTQQREKWTEKHKKQKTTCICLCFIHKNNAIHCISTKLWITVHHLISQNIIRTWSINQLVNQ